MTEIDSYSFRTAVGGFHKGDVSTYIAKTAVAHRSELAKMQQTLDALREENETLREENETLQQQFMQYQEASAAGSTGVENAEPIPGLPQQAPRTSLEEQELRAYRRAEAAERLACQRAKKLYLDMQSICDASARQIRGIDTTAQAAIDAIGQQLQLVRDTLEQVQSSIHTSADTLQTMGNLIPDPAEGLEEPE